MSEELKINNIPLFNIGEEAEIENKLLFHLDEFTNEIMKTMTRDKEIIILKKVIEQQQKEIKELKENELLEITENFVSKDKIRAKIQIYKNKKADSIGMLINYEYWKAKIEILQELLEEK